MQACVCVLNRMIRTPEHTHACLLYAAGMAPCQHLWLCCAALSCLLPCSWRTFACLVSGCQTPRVMQACITCILTRTL